MLISVHFLLSFSFAECFWGKEGVADWIHIERGPYIKEGSMTQHKESLIDPNFPWKTCLYLSSEENLQRMGIRIQTNRVKRNLCQTTTTTPWLRSHIGNSILKLPYEHPWNIHVFYFKNQFVCHNRKWEYLEWLLHIWRKKLEPSGNPIWGESCVRTREYLRVPDKLCHLIKLFYFKVEFYKLPLYILQSSSRWFKKLQRNRIYFILCW